MASVIKCSDCAWISLQYCMPNMVYMYINLEIWREKCYCIKYMHVSYMIKVLWFIAIGYYHNVYIGKMFVFALISPKTIFAYNYNDTYIIIGFVEILREFSRTPLLFMAVGKFGPWAAFCQANIKDSPNVSIQYKSV